jgi:hypothetical protein
MNASPLLHTWAVSLDDAKRPRTDIPDDTMLVLPAPSVNHAAWVLGHRACTADVLGAMIGAAWRRVHGMGRA